MSKFARITSIKRPAVIVLIGSLLLWSSAYAQIEAAGGGKPKVKEGLGRTWKGPSTTVIGKILSRQSSTAARSTGSVGVRNRQPSSPAAPSMPPSARTYKAIIFQPSGNSGVAEGLASAFSTNASEKAALLELFKQVKLAYETEVSKDGKAHNLAAALTFFLATNAVAYHDLEMPSDDATEKMFVPIRDAMNATPEIARMTNAEKEQMHDWLVYMAGFVLAGYVEAKQSKDLASQKNFRDIAAMASQILGVDISRVKITKNGLETSLLERPAPKADKHAIIFVPELLSDPLT